jgi:hypothetical protein
VDLFFAAKYLRVQIAQQPVADRCFFLDQLLQPGYVQFRTRNLLQHAYVIQPVCRHVVRAHHLRPAEKGSLKVYESLIPRPRELILVFDFFG